MRFLTIGVLAILLSTSAQAQYSKVSLNVNGGYTFGDKVYFDNSYVHVSSGFQYGGGLEYFTSRTQSVELSYDRMAATYPLYGPNGLEVGNTTADGSVNYILLGGNRYVSKSYDAKAAPYFGGGIGVGVINANGSSTTKFAWNIKAGVKVKTNSAVSIKLHAYLQSMISTAGSDYYYGWGGYVYAVPNYVSLWQFGLGGAFCFDFKHHGN